MLTRERLPLNSMVVHRCRAGFFGGVQVTEEPFKTMTNAELAEVYRERLYEYARPGDYIGLVQNLKKGSLVEFHVTPTHNNLRDPTWLRRVADIYRVVLVDRGA